MFGVDYVPFDLTLTFNSPGEECGNIYLLSDEALEGDHFFTVSIDSTSPDVQANGSQCITIVDADGKIGDSQCTT